MWRFLPRVMAMRIDTSLPFSALFTLWLSMIRRWGYSSFPFLLLTAGDAERVMNAMQHTIALHQTK